ncbi:cupredoxin domain-containing protein [Candidatus Gottesmanbacteria bacterium]|nr:cupredoxin domain-containing protein [Candidatus Gottesmanbacteria bacterium]
MDKLIVTITGISLIAGIYWFFFGKKSGEAGSRSAGEEASDTWDILVDGGYKPNVIKIKKNQPAVLTFIRKDPNTCLEELVFPDYKIKEYLPMNMPVTITLTPPHQGKSGFHCGMNMYHGRIEVTS